jgi:hypothetical protein
MEQREAKRNRVRREWPFLKVIMNGLIQRAVWEGESGKTDRRKERKIQIGDLSKSIRGGSEVFVPFSSTQFNLP